MNVDQTRSLRGVTKKRRAPFHYDERACVRWPATLGHLCANEAHAMMKALSSQRVNALLVFVPLGLLGGALKWNPVTVFVLNFLAILPFAPLLNFATDELSLHAGTLGNVLDALFGRPVDLIIGIVALSKGQVRLVQSSMLGSILFNILFVLGCSFVIGGMVRREQAFNITVSSTMASLMTIAAASLVLPATFSASVGHSKNSDDSILILSRGTAMILLFLYASYLFFKLRTHGYLTEAESTEHDEEPGEEAKTLGPITAVLAICLFSALVVFSSIFLLDSVTSIVAAGKISQSFFGILLIPMMGNAVENLYAGAAASKDEMELVINLALGNSMQIALLITPVLVILGWIIGQPMSLNFSSFEAIMSFVTVFLVSLIIQNGKSNYLEGVMCVGIYIIIALAVYFLPDEGNGVGVILA